MIKVKSVYAKASQADGRRVLVDLFWPEGLKTLQAQVDEWIHDLAPTYDLQRFNLNRESWEDYRSQYEAELLSAKEKKSRLQQLAEEANNGPVTLLYGTKDPLHNHAMILKELIENGQHE